MSTGTHIPDWLGVLASIVLVLIAIGVSMRAHLGLTRELLWAAGRAFVQLVAVGIVLTLLFTRAGLPGALLWVTGMVAVAGFVAAGRSRGLPQGRRIAWVSVGAGTATTVGVLLVLGVIEPVPSVVVPVGGMVVSGSMTAASLTMRNLAGIADTQRADIEARLALGLRSEDAMAPHLRRAAITALVPAIDSTKVVGLIALPGAMTGLILAGVEPIVAVRYQIVVMYMLLAAASLSAVVATRMTRRALFDDADRLHRVPPTS